MADRDKHVYMAKLAEQAEKYDEMARAMKRIVELKAELTVEERNMLSVAYKNMIGARRASWRTMNNIEEKEVAKGEKTSKGRLEVIVDYRMVIEREMTEICVDVVKILEEYLIPSCQDFENKTFFYKMLGDYYRYMAEYTKEDPKENAMLCEKALEAYREGTDIVYSKDGMPPTHPIRLGLMLNFSVFFYEIIGEKAKAVMLARDAFDEAIIQLEALSEDSFKDTTLIMQLLRENLTVWTTELEEAEEMEAQGAVEASMKANPQVTDPLAQAPQASNPMAQTPQAINPTGQASGIPK